MPLKSLRVAGEPALADSAHEIEAAARSVVFVTGDYVGRTSLETKPAVNTGEKFFFFMPESRCEL
jgi:hypothetical protein